MGKQRVEVGLRAQMEDNVKVRMIQMRENSEELAIDALHGGGEGRVECMVYNARRGGQSVTRYSKGSDMIRTGIVGEDVFIVYQLLNRRNNIIDVGWCRQGHLLPVPVGPKIVQPAQHSSRLPRIEIESRKETYDGPADMVGHVWEVHFSAITP